jgi:hypothetical protein
MPASAQGLYLQLMFAADDDGFVKNPRTIARMSNASDDDLQVLLSRRYLLEFDHGVVLIKHWRMHNLRRFDRYVHTVYVDEYNSLYIKTNGAYTQNPQEGVSCRGLRVWLPTSIDNGNHIEQSRQPHQPIVATTSANDGNRINDNGNQTFNDGNHIDDKILIKKLDQSLNIENTQSVYDFSKTGARTREELLSFLETQCNYDQYKAHVHKFLPERENLFDEYTKVLLEPRTKKNEQCLLSLNEEKFVRIFNGLWNLDEIDDIRKYVWYSIQQAAKETNSGG